MKSTATRLRAGLGMLLLACAATGSAENVVFRGTTVNKIDFYGINDSSSANTVTKTNRTDHQIGVYSSLGNAGYALYTLDLKAKIAYKNSGDFAHGGPLLFSNINERNKLGELHKQFNSSWSEDIAGLGDDEDIYHLKTGMLWGERKSVPLRDAGFSIVTPLSLKGSHYHSRCSEDFTIDTTAMSGYSAGRMFELNYSKSSFRLDKKLTDQTNALGGSLLNGTAVVEGYLNDKGYSLVTLGPLVGF